MSDKKRLEALRRLLTEAHQKLGLKLGFSLGRLACADGLAGGRADDRDPRCRRRRGIAAQTKARHVAASAYCRPDRDRERIDLRSSIFDLAAARPDGKVGRLARGISKAAVFDVIRRFIFAPGQAQAAVAHRRGDEIARDGDPATNKANVAYHYDVSNAFYQLFLDEEMVYTCAYFTDDHGDIGRAQRDKLDMICRKLRLKPGDRLLDIGCGALVCHAAQHYGVEAHGVTLAEEQLKFAQEKVERLGLSDKVTLHLKDFTQMAGEFDKISSIGMFEQVGIRNHPTYFQAVNRLLKPRGLYLHHSISRRAKKTEKAFNKMPAEYRALVRYIFPGGELDHLGMSIANLERYGFEVHDVEGWREHYQRTTRLWFERLSANKTLAEAEVGPERMRMWLLYLAGCSLAFERGGALVNQTLASKRRKGPSGLPLTRVDLYG